MNISVSGVLFGLLLLVIPFYICYYFRLRILHRFLRSVVVMMVSVALMSLVVYGAIVLKSVVYDIVAFFVLAMLSGGLALGRSGLKIDKMIVPVGLGSLVGVAFASFYLLFLVFSETNPFVPHLFVPLVGLVAGGMVSINAKGLQAYYFGLLYHNQLYDYLLGNGATHREAVRHFVRRAFEASIVAASKQMASLVFVSAPFLLFAMVMCGASLLTAASFQVLFYIVVLVASLISLGLALFVGRKYSFDEYERLKDVRKVAVKEVLDDLGKQSSSSSSSL